MSSSVEVKTVVMWKQRQQLLLSNAMNFDPGKAVSRILAFCRVERRRMADAVSRLQLIVRRLQSVVG